MKNALRFAILLAMLTGSLLASAQKYCNMYTYSDQWGDENSNLVALNYTDADPCGDYSVQADVEIHMPNGYQQSASASGYPAQAIALAPIAGEAGDGAIDGTNEVYYQCAYLLASFALPINIAHKTTYGENTLGSQVIGNTRFCGYTPACSNNVTPACGNPSWTDVRPAYLACTQFLRGDFLAVRFGQGPYNCFAFDFDATGPGPCDP